MGGHSPYIMPDGRPLTNYLKAESVNGDANRPKKKSVGLRGKDLQWAQLQSHKAKLGTSSDLAELAELKMLEAAGVRRRRRWLNDMVLRHMAGPMSANDMESLFKPTPFGDNPGRVSALTQASQPEHSQIWENFRSIDPDKEAKVLQRWEEHNKEQQAGKAGPVEQPPAATALQSWGRVNKKARLALRKANVHTVLQFETQLLDYLELGQPEPLSMVLDDAYARLLVHGLSDFYGLSSTTSHSDGESRMLIAHKVEQGPYIPTITCTDVLLAMAEVPSMNPELLHAYVRTHIQGSETGSNRGE